MEGNSTSSNQSKYSHDESIQGNTVQQKVINKRIKVLQAKRKNKQNRINFLNLLASILENKEYIPYIHWDHKGELIVIENIHGFAQHVLPIEFSHKNMNSFIRQLNMYGFRKQITKHNSAIYSNSLFLRSCPELRKKIVRSTTKALREADQLVTQQKQEMNQVLQNLKKMLDDVHQAKVKQQKLLELSQLFQESAGNILVSNLKQWESFVTSVHQQRDSVASIAPHSTSDKNDAVVLSSNSIERILN